MTPYKWLRLCGTTVSAAMVLLLSCACLAAGIGAQSAESAIAGPALSTAAPSPFLVAPTIPLGYAPSSVATGDFRKSGRFDLVTADFSSGNIAVFLGAGKGKFAPGVEYAVGAHPTSVRVVDLNGDGRPDILVANHSEGTISVLFGNGDGTFQARQSFKVGFNPSFIATGDFDGSGKVDVAVAGTPGNLLAVLLNDGSGNLQKPVTQLLSKAPTALAAADFNHDGRTDLAFANADGTISVLIGKGAGMFRTLPDLTVAAGSLSSIEAGDLSNSGKIDLIVTEPGRRLVSVLIGKGDGTFAAPASYPVGNEPVSTVVADVNGDGIPALVVINKSSNTFSILGGNGDGSFKASVDFVAGNAPLAAVAGDFYGNGRVDLAIINHSSQTVSVPLGNGDGTFKAARSYSSGVQPMSVASGTLNGGKIPALVVANYCGSDSACGAAGTVAVFLADETGEYHLFSTYTVGAGPVSVALADVNGDRKLDIVALNRLDKTATVMLGLGDGTFRQPMTFSLAGAPLALAVGDLNKDGKPDLAILEDCGAAKCSQPGSVEVLLGAGDGSFRSVQSYSAGYSPSSIALGAISGDQHLDLVIANRCGNDASCHSAGTATVLIGDGTGKFSPGTEVALGNSPSAIALGKLTGPALDLVVARSMDNAVAVLRGNGDGTFKTGVAYAVGNRPGSLVVADFNGDGTADVAVANVEDSTVSVLFGKGDGTLHPAAALTVGSGPIALASVGGANTKHAGLATANGATSVADAAGDSGAAKPGTEFSVLPNLQSDPPLASFTVVPSPTPDSKVNEGVLLTATLTGVAPNPAPTGTVTFQSNPGTGAVDLSDCTNVAIVQGISPSLVSTATCTTQMLTAGTDSITAVYSGDAVYDPGVGETSPPAVPSQSVSKDSTTTSVLSSSLTSTVNQQVAFTAVVTPSTTGPILPTGTVSLVAVGPSPSVAQTAMCTETIADGTVPVCNYTFAASGTYTVVATYNLGDSNFTSSASPSSGVGAYVQTVSAAITSVVLASSPSSSVVNQPVTFSAAIDTNSGITVPQGTMTYTDSVVGNLCTTTLTSAGIVPACTYSFPGPPATHSITVTFTTSNTNFNSSAPSNAVSEVVSKAATTTGVVSAPNPSAVNQQVAFTATVTPQYSGTTKPTGTVSFVAIGPSPALTQAAMCTETIAGGAVPVCNYIFTASGTYTVVATYNVLTDANFTTSSSPSSGAGADVQTVNAGTNSVVLASSLNPSVVNQPVVFSATISVANSGSAQPTGSVVYADAGTAIPGCTFGSAGSPVVFTGGVVPSCTVGFSSSSTVVAHSIVATFTSANSNFTSAPSNAVSQVVNKATPVTSVTSLPNPAAVNAAVTATATVTSTYTAGTAVPTGNVVFTTNPATTSCTETIVAGVVPVCTFKFASKGTYDIVATYQGDQNFNTSPSGAVADAEAVGVEATTVDLTSSTPANTSVVNQSVTFSATIEVTAGSPTGVVAFKDGATVLCTVGSAGSPATFVNGVVPPCTTTLFAATTSSVTHAITASYSGDSNFGPSTGDLTQIVNPAATATTIVSTVASVTSNSAPLNTPVTYAATVTPNPAPTAGSLSPTGTVTFQYIGTNGTLPATQTNLCPAVGVSPGSGTATASCVALLPTAGTYAITATYNGDQNFSASNKTNPPNAQTVTRGATTTSVTSSSTTSSVNQSVAFTATVAPSLPGGTAVPTGSVSFLAIGPSPAVTQTPMCTQTIANGAVPVCNYTFTASGTYTVVATYNVLADPNFMTSSSPSSGAGADVQTVTAGANSVVLASSLNPSLVNQPVTFNATISVPNSGTAQPIGSVVYADGGLALPGCTFGSAGSPVTFTGGIVAPCTVAFSSASSAVVTHSIVATFTSANANFNSGPSNTVSQTVNITTTTTSVASATNPSTVNSSVTFTATVTPAFTAGKAVPTGTLSFSATPIGGAQTPLMCTNTGTQPITVTPSGGLATATCTAPLTAAGNYTISAAYATGDANFSSSAGTVSQIVGKANLTLAVISSYVQGGVVIISPPLQGSSLVNQALTFTATLTIPTAGTPPVSTVTFNDTLTGATLCPDVAVVPTPSPTTFKAVCVPPAATPWIANTHTIVATYNNGDPNFPSTPSPVFSQVVTPGPASVALLSSMQTSVATETVIFTATITPTQTGPVLPTGDFKFTSSTPGLWIPTAPCPTVQVVKNSGNLAGTATAVCTVQFPATAESQKITATYENDPNFILNGSSVAQTVQNFTIANSVTSALDTTSTTGPVYLTQGYSTATPSAAGTDPFNPTNVQMVVTSTGGFVDTLGLACQVRNAISNAVVADPSCTVSATAPGATGTALTYTVTSSPSTPIGEYAVTLTATDNSTPALASATTLTVYLVGQANVLSLAQGASGTETANFNTTTAPANSTLVSFTCGTVWNLTTKTQLSASQIAGLTCTGPASVAITGGSTPASITISTLGKTTALLRASSTISLAAFLGIPLFALIGWVGSRKSPRKNFFRFLGLIPLLVGVSYASGCGGSFTSTSKSTNSGIAPGSYLVQVVGTDQNGNKYYAAVPLDVSAN